MGRTEREGEAGVRTGAKFALAGADFVGRNGFLPSYKFPLAVWPFICYTGWCNKRKTAGGRLTFGVLSFSKQEEKRMLFQKKKTAIDWLIVGLGNPGMTYEHTRHNAGIDALTVLAKDHGITLSKKQFKAMVGTGEIGGKKVVLMFPQTFMNASGEAVREAMNFYKLSAGLSYIISAAGGMEAASSDSVRRWVSRSK